MTLGGAIKLWLAVKPIKRIKARRARKRAVKSQEGVVVRKKWYKSLTIQGLAASAAALGLQFLGVGDAEVATLSTRIVEWCLEGSQIGGLLVAAYGRKRATAPLE